MSIKQNALTPAETREFEKCKKTIKENINAVWETAKALKIIHDKRYYLRTHSSYEAFCKSEFKIGKSHAYRLIGAESTREAISTTPMGDGHVPIGDASNLIDRESGVSAQDANKKGPGSPLTEGQLRPLSKLPEKDRAEAWAKAVKTAKAGDNGKPNVTAKHVEKVVEGILEEGTSFDFGANVEGEEPDIEPMKDGHGTIIPSKLEEIFTDGPPTIKDLMNRTSKLNKDIKETVSDTPGCQIIPIIATEIALKDCRTALKSAIPTWVCVCNGRGCKKCDNRGWLQKQCGVLFDEVQE